MTKKSPAENDRSALPATDAAPVESPGALPFPSLAERSMLLNARRIDRGDGEGTPKLILLAFQDCIGSEADA